MKVVIKDRYKAAVIGIGRIGMKHENDPKRLKPATHFGMWNSSPCVELSAVCDPVSEHLQMANSLNPDVRTYTDAEELLKDVKPDIVSIATWKDTHYEMMKLCSKYEIPAIVCEKPIAESIEHAREIVDELNEKGIHLFINHRRRFDELLYPLREDLKNGIIGEVIQANCLYVYGLITTGTHVIDTLRFLLKDIAGEVKWVIGSRNTFPHFSPPDDPCVDGLIGFENGLKVALQSLNIKDYDLFDFYFYGRKGKVVIKNIGRDIEIYQIRESPEHEGFTELADKPVGIRGGYPRDQFSFLAKNVVESLQGKANSLSTGEDSLKALEVLTALEKSVALGSRIVEV